MHKLTKWEKKDNEVFFFLFSTASTLDELLLTKNIAFFFCPTLMCEQTNSSMQLSCAAMEQA